MEHSDNVVDSPELSHFDKAFDQALELKVLESTELLTEVSVTYHVSCKILMQNLIRNKQNAINRSQILSRNIFNSFTIKDCIKYGTGYRFETVASQDFSADVLYSILKNVQIEESKSKYDIFTKAFNKQLLAFVIKSPIGDTAFTYNKTVIIKKTPTYDIYIEIFARPNIALKLAPIRYQRTQIMDQLGYLAHAITNEINLQNEDDHFVDKIILI